MRYLCLIIILLFVTCNVGKKPQPEVTLSDLPDFQYGTYKVDPYIQVASDLQALGKESAVKKMRDYAQAIEHDKKIIILCRMLFSAKPNSEFRRPRIGAPAFIGKTDYSDWPLEPIEIVDGVPFLIVTGYMLGGMPEPAEMYLDYCLQNCEWNTFRYEMKNEQMKREALKKFLASPKWKSTPPEGFLLGQIQ